MTRLAKIVYIIIPKSINARTTLIAVWRDNPILISTTWKTVSLKRTITYVARIITGTAHCLVTYTIIPWNTLTFINNKYSIHKTFARYTLIIRWSITRLASNVTKLTFWIPIRIFKIWWLTNTRSFNWIINSHLSEICCHACCTVIDWWSLWTSITIRIT